MLGETLQQKLSKKDFDNRLSNIHKQNEKLFQKIKQKNINKIKLLEKRQLAKKDTHHTENTQRMWITNLTNTNIPEFPSRVTDPIMQLKFTINISIQQKISFVVWNHLLNYTKEVLRAKTCNIPTNFKNK